MATAEYTVRPHAGGWVVEHEGELSTSYATKEAALEAAIGPASNAIKEGLGVMIVVPPRVAASESALGGAADLS